MIQTIAALFDPEGVLAALGLMVLATTTPFPAELAALGIAMQHGFWAGLGLIWIGSMLGALISYGLGLWLCPRAGWITRARPVRVARERMGDLGWMGILGLRLIPLVPFFALSLAAGLIRTPAGAYLAGTALGILPASSILALLAQGLISDRTWVVATTALAALALPLMLWLLTRRRNARSRCLGGWSAPAPAAPLLRDPR